MRASSTLTRCWTWDRARVLGFALGEHHDADLAYGALAVAVAVRGGQVPGVIFHTDYAEPCVKPRNRVWPVLAGLPD